MGIGTLRRYHNSPKAEKAEDIDRPTRASSKRAWLDYAAANDAPEGFEDMTRDQIADLYLGPRE